MKIVTILLFFILSLPAISQTTGIQMKEECADCKIDCMCKLYFSNYLSNENNRKIITSNWSDFFGADLKNLFPMSMDANVVTIKFDGLGCIYPENNAELINIRDNFLDDKNVKYKNFYAHSFFDLFYKQDERVNQNVNNFILNEGFPDSFKESNAVKKSTLAFNFIKKWK